MIDVRDRIRIPLYVYK